MEVAIVVFGFVALSYAGLAPFTERTGDTPKSELSIPQRIRRQITRQHF